MIEQGKWTRKFRTKKKTREADAADPTLAYTFMVRTGITVEKHRSMSFFVPGPAAGEERDKAKEMIRWCRNQFGMGNDRWNNRLLPEQRRQEREMCFLFSNYQDAMAFVLRWR